MTRLFDWLNRVGTALASCLFVAAGAMLTYEVIARYFFTKPTSWAAELSQMCLIWGALLAMASLLSKRQHIQVDAVVQLLPGHVVRWVDMLVLMVVGIFSGVVTWYGFEIFYDSFIRGRTTGSMLNIPIWIVELAVPVGFFMLTLQCVYEIKRTLFRVVSPAEGVSS
ncbi:TRAP transporter small permease [Granulosicoccus antarcticus]|uniref:TRAP transporter small permease n=1 Tax=Granulosicoccus antarcticus TaxID=437505 RepID=UPI00197A9F61|nr:TRAP transporter small permease [Granulosicoccus antarcticus]